MKTLGGGLAAANSLLAAGSLKLGLDTYSIRAYQWKAPRLIEYAAGLKLDAVQISFGDYESLEPAYLSQVKDAAERAGLPSKATSAASAPPLPIQQAEGSAEERTLRGLRASRAVGAKAMRCFLGSMSERRGNIPIDAHIETTIKVFQNIRTQAQDTGVKIALENHNGDLHASEVRYIVGDCGQGFCRCYLRLWEPDVVARRPDDNARDPPHPYIVTSHFRDSAVWETDKGIHFQWVALGDGTVDMQALVARFHELCPQAPMQLEIITGRPPQVLACYADGRDFWKAYPKVSGEQFARFAALAKRGRPYAGPMITTSTSKQPAEFDAALKLQQRLDLERSVEYAKTKLGAGLRR